MSAGKLYRNYKMADVDFFITRRTNYVLVGFWILRKSKNLATPKMDFIDVDNINPSDWIEVNE